MPKIRKWNDSYVGFGFTKVNRDDRECAQCMYCSYVMSNESLRPSKLQNHRDKNHPHVKDVDIGALAAKRVRFDKEATLTNFGFLPEENPALECSYEVAYRVAKCKKPHTIAEDLIKPCAEKMVELLIGPKEKRNMQQVPLSNSTIRRRIDDMAAVVCQQVCSEIKQSKLQASLQLDESTDTTLERFPLIV
ncbi:protein FAM200C-like [Styela clava]